MAPSNGGGVRRGDHLPPHKYIKTTSTRGTTPTEHLLNAGRRPQASQKTPSGDLHAEAGPIQSWTPGAVRTEKRKGNLSQQPQEQQIKTPQSTWCTLHLWNTWIDNESSQMEEVDFGSNDICIFSPFSLSVSVYVYAFVCDFVHIPLLLPFVLGSSPSGFVLFSFVFSIVFGSCYHWWICFLVWLLSSVFRCFFLILFKFLKF